MAKLSKFNLTRKEIATLVSAGGKAPSGGNVQPWRVTVYSNSLHVKLDLKRSDSFLDVDRYASLFAFGCFTENVEIAAQASGLIYTLRFDFSDILSKPIINLYFSGRSKKKAGPLASIYPLIDKRVTNRQLYDGTLVDESQIKELKKMVKEYDPGLKMTSFYEQQKKQAIAKTLGQADVIRMTNVRAYSQMVGEFRWSPEETRRTRDGLDLKTLELPRNLGKLFALIRKHHNIMKMVPGRVFVELTKPIIEGCSHVCCISTSATLSPERMFQAGRIMEKVWLKTTGWDIALQPWSIFPFFVFRVFYFNGEGFSKKESEQIKKLRHEFHEHFQLSPREVPLFIFRLSHAKKPSSRSLRLAWTDYTQIKS